MVGPIKGYGGLLPSEEGKRGWLGRIDLVARKLLVVLGVIVCQPSKDHEAAIQCWKAVVLLLGVFYGCVGVPPVLPLLEPPNKNHFMRQ